MRNMKKMLGIVVCLMALSMMVFASVAVAADPVTLTGNVVAAGDNLQLQAGDQTYILDGATEDMVGKTVKVTGTVEENEGNKVLVVDSIEEAK